MPIGYLLVLCFAVFSFAQQNLSTPYDLIRPVYPLTWDSTVFDNYDTTVTTKKGMVPKNRTPASFAPTALIPDTLNQAYLDAINLKISPIRINQAGYLEKDPERKFYYVGSATSFEVVDSLGNSFTPKYTGTFQSSGTTTASDWTIIAGTNAATNDQLRYQVSTVGPSGTIQIGNLPLDLPTNQRLRVKVGSDISATFIISNDVYSMVRSATLKFYGINRSGDSESWFHPASHTKDGGGPVVTDAADVRGPFNPALAGTLQGGYYDCGDHLKESQTQMYAFMVAAVLAATNPMADDDKYEYNHGNTAIDGIPDMLREAKHGADFVLRAYNRAGGIIDDMALSVGNFGSDHGWWGRPEHQDNLPTGNTATATDRGGPASRTVRLGEIGANIGGETAAGLAILAKDYAQFDKPFADSCLMVAKKMYDFAKSLATGKSTYDGGKPFVNNTIPAGWSSPAYNGNNEFFDDLALASISLFYATADPAYLDDAAESRTLNPVITQEFADGAGFFNGGWFVTENKGFLKNVKNTSWANAYSYALYAFYKLILKTPEQAALYGINETKRLEYIEDVVANMIYNLGDMSNYGSTSIVLPTGSIGWKNTTVSYDPIWFSMNTDQDWIYNRYQAGNIFEVLAYADVAKDLTNLSLPTMGSPDWKADAMYQLGISQLNYMLGVNPWDVSFILGVGDKNDAHPHHRAANPEGKNFPGAGYKYRPPTGALFGGVKPGATNSWVPSNKSWEDYHLSETCIDATATFISASMLAAQEIDYTRAPKINVEILHVSMDSAIVKLKLDVRSTGALFYGTSESVLNTTATPDNNVAAIEHEIILRGLKNGTTYYFFAGAFNALNENNMTSKYLVDSTQTPFSFTTLNTVESAIIENVTVCNLSADSAEIMWYTPNGEYESKIYWDTIPHSEASEFAWNSGTKNADISGIPTKFHYVKIGGLKEKTTYYYMVESNGEFQSVDDKGNLLKFTTPVAWYDFSVRTYQYEFGGLDFLDLNIYNNESYAFDSLTLRLYVTAKPEEIEKCAFLVDLDICQAYDEGGFNKPCETDREIRDLLRNAKAVKLEDTYNAATGTYSWYFPVPLGSTTIKASSRLRMDLGFSQGLSNDGYLTCETLRQPSNKRMTKATGDWSWSPHLKEVDGAFYDGMPFEDKDYGDIDDNIPVNPYIVVYRKDEFIWGYSPSYQEMTTKRANYEIGLTLEPPFNVSNGSHVVLDQNSSTVYFKGTASVTEGGFITRIWANGTEVKDLASAAKYNVVTDMYDLNIPVKMTIGSNKVDVTVFAGPDPTCQSCTENGGCDFENRNFFVQFTKGNASASNLRITDASGNAISSPAEPNSTSFYIHLSDKDKANYTGVVNALVINGRQKDTLRVKLDPETAGSGTFRSGSLISAVSKTPAERNASTEISFFGGDTIQVIYIDPEDEEDISRQTFYAKATYPTPQKVLAQDLNCDGIADNISINFSTTFDGSVSFDSLWIHIKDKETATGDSFMVPVIENMVGKNTINIPLTSSSIPATPTPEGYISTFLQYNGVVSKESAEITDGIAPVLVSVTVLENPEPRSTEDTIKIAFSEKVTLASLSAWPLSIVDGSGNPVDQSAITVSGKATTEDDGKSYLYVVTGNFSGNLMKPGFIASIPSSFSVSDLKLNRLDGNSCQKPVTIAETPKPVPVKLAEIRDFTGDGYPDEIFLRFERKLRDKDMLDSFVVDWGSPSVIKSFLSSSWVHTQETSDPYYSYVVRMDTLPDGTINPVITDSILKQDTLSIITITIPSTNTYELGTTTGDYNGYGKIKPRLGPEGGFFDKTYSLVDKVPPIILSARKTTSSELEVLEIEMSEPLKEEELGEYHIERKRGSETTYFSPMSTTFAQNKYTFIYNDEAPGAIRIGDYIRLIPSNTISKYKDVAGNFPGTDNPWVQVKGSIAEKTYFKVTLENDITQPSTTVIPYNGVMPTDSEHFRLTVLNQNQEIPLAKGKGKLKSAFGEAPYDTAKYKHGGPTFEIEANIPSALTLVSNVNAWNFEIAFEVFLYDNLGQFINSASYSFLLSDIGYDKVSIDGKLPLRLEWLSQDGVAPVSESGKKIGTGPYIARFNLKSNASYMVDPVNEEDTYKKGDKLKVKEQKTSTFGFRRLK